MGAPVSQVMTSQGNQSVNPQPTQANYSPAQQHMGGKFAPMALQQQAPVGASMEDDIQPQFQQTNIHETPTFVRAQNPSQIGQSDQGSGKGMNRVMYSPTSNQPSMGQPNPYPNTVGQWDNASIQPQNRGFGKGKGG